MEDPDKGWRRLPVDPERGHLLCPGVAPGQLGASTEAPFFQASGRPGLPRKAPPSHHEGKDPVGAASARFRQSILMIDGEKRIQLRNASAAALLARGDLVFEHKGALSCRDRDSDRRLSMAIGTLQPGSRSREGLVERRTVWLCRPEGHGAAATLHLLRGEEDEGRAASVVMNVVDAGAAPAADPQVIALAYKLTSAEARLASMIAVGYSTAHCSRELAVKTSTLRSHLSAIYRKTGARGKADLVRLVLSLCAI